MNRSISGLSKLLTHFATAAVTVGLCGVALAVDLPPAQSVTPVPEVEVGGNELTSMSVSLGAGPLSGALTSTVQAGDPFNPLGGLTFTYQLLLNEESHAVARLTVSSFEGYLTEVGYAAHGNEPYVADRESAGAVVGFSFPFAIGLPPGSESTLLVVRTDAPEWEPSVASVINGGQTTVESVAPLVIPEPAGYALTLAGGLALLLLFRRRN